MTRKFVCAERLAWAGLLAIGVGGCHGFIPDLPAAPPNPPPGPPLAPIVWIRLNAFRVPIGVDTLRLTWSSTNAGTCEKGGDWSGLLIGSTSGSQLIMPTVPGTLTYRLDCFSLGGTASASASVEVLESSPGILP